MKKGTIGIVCALCIVVTSFVQGISASEMQKQPEEKANPLNTTIETAIKLENVKLYDDFFTQKDNVRYYKFTAKKMSRLDFNVNSDAKGKVKLLNDKGQKIIGWNLRGENLGFTYIHDDPSYLLWDDYAHCIAEEELIEPGTYYIEVTADKGQFSEKKAEIRFHMIGYVGSFRTSLALKKENVVYTGKEIQIPKVKVEWVVGKEKYVYDDNGKKHRIKYDCVIDRKTGKEIKSIKKIGSYLICNRSFIDDAVNAWGASCAVFTVTPQKGVLKEAKSKKAGQIQAIAKKNTAAGRYQLQVSTDKKFKTNVQTVNTKETKQTVKNLESGKRYYVRVRYYKNVPIKYNHGMGKPQPIYGKWSKAKTVVCK